MDELEAELAEVSGRLSAARAGRDRLRIARETVAEVLAEMTSPVPAVGLFEQQGHRPKHCEQYYEQCEEEERADPCLLLASPLVQTFGLYALRGVSPPGRRDRHLVLGKVARHLVYIVGVVADAGDHAAAG